MWQVKTLSENWVQFSQKIYLFTMAINFLDYTEKLCSGIGRNTIISILLWVCRYFTWVPPYFIVNKFKFSLTSNFSKIVSKESITTSHFFMALLLSIVWEKGESYKLILNLSLVSLHGHARHWWFGGGYYWKAWPDRILACNLGSDWHHIQPPPSPHVRDHCPNNGK